MAGARWNIAGRGTLQVVRYAVSLTLARLVGPAEFGLMAIALVVAGLLDFLRDLGTAQAVVQRRSLSPELLSSLFWLNLGLGVAIGAALALGADGVAALYGSHAGLAGILQILGATCVVSSCSIVQRALLTRRMQFGRLAATDLVGAAANGVVAVALAWQGYGVLALVAGYVASTLSSTALVWLLSRWRPSFQLRLSELRAISGFTLNLAASNVLTYALRNADSIIISRLLGIEALGLYSVAQRLVLYPMRTLAALIQGVLLPAFARFQDDPERLRADLLRSCTGVVLVAWPALACIGLLAEPLTRVVLGDRWLSSAPIAELLAPIAMLMIATYSVGPIYPTLGRTDWQFRWGVARGLLILAGYAVGAQWGLEGLVVGFGIAIALSLYPTFAIPFSLIELRFSALLEALRPYAVATAATGVAVLCARLALQGLAAAPVFVLAGSAAVAIGTYALVAWRLRLRALEDLFRLLAIRRQARGRRPASETAP
jgi:PST family polysaccharide transporter